MSETEDTADTEFDKLLENVDFGKLDIVESCADGQDTMDELYGIVIAPADDTLSTSGMAHPLWKVWETALGAKLVPGVLPFFFPCRHLFKTWCLLR